MFGSPGQVMSLNKGLGSPHLGGSGQPRPPRLTPKEVVDEIASGCGVLLLAPVAIVGGIAALLSVLYLPGVLIGWSKDALEEPLVLVAVGVSLIGLAVLGSYRVFRNRRSPEVTLLAVVSWVLLDVVLDLARCNRSRTGDQPDRRAQLLVHVLRAVTDQPRKPESKVGGPTVQPAGRASWTASQATSRSVMASLSHRDVTGCPAR